MDKVERELAWAQLLREGRHRDAALAVCDFQVQQERPDGLNMNWLSQVTRDRFVTDMANIFSIKPTILGALTEDQWQAVRIRAGMLFLTGNNRAPSRWGLIGVAVGNMGPDATARMILFPATDADKFERWAKLGVNHARISIAPDACGHCQSFEGAVYPTDRAPELPHPLCDHEMGCRCGYSPVFDNEL